jgi:hypothetical protein
LGKLTQSQEQIRRALRTHQRRLAASDQLRPITDIARLAGVSRDTLYALMAGDRINVRSQYALSRAMAEVEEENRTKLKTNLAHITFSQDGPKLSFGIAMKPLFRHK